MISSKIKLGIVVAVVTIFVSMGVSIYLLWQNSLSQAEARGMITTAQQQTEQSLQELRASITATEQANKELQNKITQIEKESFRTRELFQSEDFQNLLRDNPQQAVQVVNENLQNLFDETQNVVSQVEQVSNEEDGEDNDE